VLLYSSFGYQQYPSFHLTPSYTTYYRTYCIERRQYPIYSALIAKMGGRQVGYELDESLNWAVSREELESKLEKAKKEGLEVRAMAMINPGNPSGNVMTHCDSK